MERFWTGGLLTVWMLWNLRASRAKAPAVVPAPCPEPRKMRWWRLSSPESWPGRWKGPLRGAVTSAPGGTEAGKWGDAPSSCSPSLHVLPVLPLAKSTEGVPWGWGWAAGRGVGSSPQPHSGGPRSPPLGWAPPKQRDRNNTQPSSTPPTFLDLKSLSGTCWRQRSLGLCFENGSS